MKNILLMLLVLKITISCNKKQNADHVNSFSEKKIDTVNNISNPYMVNYGNKKEMKKLLDSAIIYGDTLSYQEAFKNYLVSEHTQEFLYYSIKMAKIHNYGEAYFDTYYIMNLLDNRNDYISREDKNLSLYYLLKAYEMNNLTAKDKINDLFIKKNKKIPTSNSILNN